MDTIVTFFEFQKSRSSTSVDITELAHPIANFRVLNSNLAVLRSNRDVNLERHRAHFYLSKLVLINKTTSSAPIPYGKRDEETMRLIWGRYLTHDEVAGVADGSITNIEGFVVSAGAAHSHTEVTIRFTPWVRISVEVGHLFAPISHWFNPAFDCSLRDYIKIVAEGYSFIQRDDGTVTFAGTREQFFALFGMGAEENYEETWERLEEEDRCISIDCIVDYADNPIVVYNYTV